MRARAALAICVALAAGACGEEDAPAVRAQVSTAAGSTGGRAVPEPSETAAPAPPAPPGAAPDQGRYTSLEGCRLLVSKPDEAGYSVEQCPGLDGFTLKRNEADGRQNLFVIAPDGGERSLNLPGVIGAGFSTVGPRVEWRGGRPPTALIVRYAVVEDPEAPERPTSYLAVARLESGTACVIGKVPPGPEQNARARRLADAGGPCLETPS